MGGFPFFYSQPCPPPNQMGLNYSDSRILTWNSNFSCIFMESCIIFRVIPAKQALYLNANIGVLITLTCAFQNSLLWLFCG